MKTLKPFSMNQLAADINVCCVELEAGKAIRSEVLEYDDRSIMFDAYNTRFGDLEIESIHIEHDSGLSEGFTTEQYKQLEKLLK